MLLGSGNIERNVKEATVMFINKMINETEANSKDDSTENKKNKQIYGLITSCHLFSSLLYHG